MGTTSIRRSQATPSPRRTLQRRTKLLSERFDAVRRSLASRPLTTVAPIPAQARTFDGARGLRLLLNLSVAALVLSLPLAATAASSGSASESVAATASIANVDIARAQPQGRSGVITAGRSPVTVAAEGTRPLQQLEVHEDDTLSTIANYFGISSEALGYSNGIADPTKLHIGQILLIPPAEGALYTVAEADTVESVAQHFKVDAAVIMSYNRVYFEPEHFAPGQLIFVPGASVPALVEPVRAPVVSRIAPGTAPPRTGRLAWPVGGVITQYFWWGHTGVDIAAPYGRGIGAPDDGVVTATGWVAVGGLRVCLAHSGGLQTCYYHTGAVFVSPGQTVSRGQIIASIGLTGVTTGPHVHWECRLGGVFVSCLGL